MQRKLWNVARLGLDITPRGPILIKSGIATPDPTRPDMEFVRQRHPTLGDTVYLPGSSLKGVLRAHAERLLLAVGKKVCNPFHDSCGGRGDKQDKEDSSAATFSRQCPVCRTFGSLRVAGRCAIGDAMPWRPEAIEDEQRKAAAVANRTERRTQVAIDRKTGATQRGALFDLEVVVAGCFSTEILLRNFQLWQLGLVAALIADLDDGLQRVGFGKSRGLGSVKARIHRIDLEVTRRDATSLLGVGALCDDSERASYHLEASDEADLPVGLRFEPTWRGSRLAAAGDAVSSLLAAVEKGPLRRFVGTGAAA